MICVCYVRISLYIPLEYYWKGFRNGDILEGYIKLSDNLFSYNLIQKLILAEASLNARKYSWKGLCQEVICNFNPCICNLFLVGRMTPLF